MPRKIDLRKHSTALQLTAQFREFTNKNAGIDEDLCLSEDDTFTSSDPNFAPLQNLLSNDMHTLKMTNDFTLLSANVGMYTLVHRRGLTFENVTLLICYFKIPAKKW